MSILRKESFRRAGPRAWPSHSAILTAGCLLAAFWSPLSGERSINLEEAIERAFAVEQIDAFSDAARREADGRRRAAAAIPNPSIVAEREALRGAGANFRETTLGLSMPIDFLWKRGARREAAGSRAKIAEWQLEDHRRHVSREIAGLFMDHGAAEEEQFRHASAHDALERAQRVARAATREGDAPASLLRRVNLAVARHRFEEAGIEVRLQEIRFRLASLLDLEEVIPVAELPTPPVFAGAAAVEEFALSRRPDLKASSLAVDWLRAEEQLARREGGPSASILAARKEDNAGRDGYLVGITVEVPLFDRNQGAARVAKADLTRAEIAHARARRMVAAEARGAYLRWVQIQEHWNSLEAAETDGDAETFLRTTGAAFEAGETSLLEYLDAVETYLESWHNRIQMRKSLHRASLDLLHVTASALER